LVTLKVDEADTTKHESMLCICWYTCTMYIQNVQLYIAPWPGLLPNKKVEGVW